MTDKDNNQINLEMNELLSPLTNVAVRQDKLEKWRLAVDKELASDCLADVKVTTHPFSRRLIEWAVAASIGFVVATAWKGLSQKESEKDYFSDIDATELHFVAKSD